MLHRNLLLPCEHLPLENWHELTRKTTETQRTTKRVPRNESEDERSNSDSDTEDEFRVSVHQPERMEVNPDTPDPVQLEIDPANEIGYIAKNISCKIQYKRTQKWLMKFRITQMTLKQMSLKRICMPTGILRT